MIINSPDYLRQESYFKSIEYFIIKQTLKFRSELLVSTT